MVVVVPLSSNTVYSVDCSSAEVIEDVLSGLEAEDIRVENGSGTF